MPVLHISLVTEAVMHDLLAFLKTKSQVRIWKTVKKWLDFKNMNFVETWVSIRKVEHKCVGTGVQAVSHPLHTAAVNIGGPGRAVNCQSNVFFKE